MVGCVFLSVSDLMRLKRVRATEATLEEKGDGMISRADPGLCFDFPTTDTSIYYAGTEVRRTRGHAETI